MFMVYTNIFCIKTISKLMPHNECAEKHLQARPSVRTVWMAHGMMQDLHGETVTVWTVLVEDVALRKYTTFQSLHMN